MFEANQTQSLAIKPQHTGRGGARKGAGRPKGAVTVRTQEIATRLVVNGLTPLEYMLQIMRTEPAPEVVGAERKAAESFRFEAAKAAAPYMHTRLAPAVDPLAVRNDPSDIARAARDAIAAADATIGGPGE